MNRKWAIGVIAVVVAVIAVVLVTRGGDGSSEQVSAKEKGHEKGGGKNGGKPDPSSVGEKGSTEKGSETVADKHRGGGNEGGEPSQAELNASRRIQDRVAVNTVAGQNVLQVFGLEGEVRIQDEGRVIVVIVARSSACDAVPADEARIREFTLDAQPTVRKVVVKVAGANEPLGAYVSANCTAPEFPGGSGSTEFQQSGEGAATTEPFTVRGPKWAIDYQIDGASLFIFVLKGGEVIDPAIAQQARGTGTQTYKGGGTYKLEIRGSGFWKVRIRDGA